MDGTSQNACMPAEAITITGFVGKPRKSLAMVDGAPCLMRHVAALEERMKHTRSGKIAGITDLKPSLPTTLLAAPIQQ